MTEDLLRLKVWNLALRLSQFGAASDIYALTYIELEALRRFLERLQGAG